MGLLDKFRRQPSASAAAVRLPAPEKDPVKVAESAVETSRSKIIEMLGKSAGFKELQVAGHQALQTRDSIRQGIEAVGNRLLERESGAKHDRLGTQVEQFITNLGLNGSVNVASLQEELRQVVQRSLLVSTQHVDKDQGMADKLTALDQQIAQYVASRPHFLDAAIEHRTAKGALSDAHGHARILYPDTPERRAGYAAGLIRNLLLHKTLD